MFENDIITVGQRHAGHITLVERHPAFHWAFHTDIRRAPQTPQRAQAAGVWYMLTFERSRHEPVAGRHGSHDQTIPNFRAEQSTTRPCIRPLRKRTPSASSAHRNGLPALPSARAWGVVVVRTLATGCDRPRSSPYGLWSCSRNAVCLSSSKFFVAVDPPSPRVRLHEPEDRPPTSNVSWNHDTHAGSWLHNPGATKPAQEMVRTSKLRSDQSTVLIGQAGCSSTRRQWQQHPSVL